MTGQQKKKVPLFFKNAVGEVFAATWTFRKRKSHNAVLSRVRGKAKQGGHTNQKIAGGSNFTEHVAWKSTLYINFEKPVVIFGAETDMALKLSI